MDDLFTCEYSTWFGGTNGHYINQTGGCPPNKEAKEFADHPDNIRFIPNNLEDYYTFLETTYSIDRSWVTFIDFQYDPCIQSVTLVDCSTFGHWLSEPVADPNMVVPDPKDIISSALSNLTDLRDFLADAETSVAVGLYFDSTADLVDAASLPTFMVLSAVASMKSVADIGEQVEEAEKKAMILAFLSAFLIFIPFVGEAAEVVIGAAVIARIVNMIAVAGDVAFSIYSIVDDPKNAPLAIMGLLLGLGGLRGISRTENIASAAAIRRGMSADQLGGLGADVGANMAKVKQLVRACSRV